MRRGSFSGGEPEAPVPTVASASASISRPTSKSENRASPSKTKKAAKSSKTVTAEDIAHQDEKIEVHSDDEQVGSGDDELYSDVDERDYDHAHDHDPEETDGIILLTVRTPRVKRNRSTSPSKRPSSNTQIRKSRDFDSNDGTDSRGASREGPRARRGSVMAEARPNSKNIKAAAEEGMAKRKQVNVKKVNVNLSDSAKIKTKAVVPKVVKRVVKVKKPNQGASTSATEETETEQEAQEGEEEEEEEVEIEVEEGSGDEAEAIEQVADDDGELEGVEEEGTAEGTENGDESGNHEADQEEEVDTFVETDDVAPVTPPRALSRQPSSNKKLQKQDSLPKKKDPPITSPEASRASPVPNSTTASRRGSIGVLPLPKRRRSIPKSFSFLRQSLSTDHNASSNFSAALAAVNAAHNPQPMQDERKEELKADFAEGAFRMEEPRSIVDEDDDPKDRAHTKFVPIIPIEVRRYVGDKTPKKKFVPTKEEVIYTCDAFLVFVHIFPEAFV